MHKVLVLNSKGGCGKSTLATNLAGYYASKGYVTTFIDYDTQGTGMKWLSLRDSLQPKIHGIAAFSKHGEMTRSWQMRVPHNTEWVIIDAPAGVSGMHLCDYIRRADSIIIPVLPSPIDIHAAEQFIQDVLHTDKSQRYDANLAVVANRVKDNTRVFSDLRKFLFGLQLPFIASLRDSQEYMRTCEQGLGIHELNSPRARLLCQQWAPLLAWLETRRISCAKMVRNRFDTVNIHSVR